MRAHILLFGIVLGILAAGTAPAQQYNFQTYNELDGLPSSTVLDVAQDQDGLLWFATARGIARFDGVEWELVGPDGSTPTVHHAFITRDHRGRMWTAGLDSAWKLFVLEDAAWRGIIMPPEFSRGSKYLICELGQTPEGETIVALVSSKGSLHVYCDGRWRDYAIGTKETRITALAFVAGRLLIASSSGLFQIDTVVWQLAATAETRPLRSVCPTDDGGGLWVVGEDWIGVGPVGNMRTLVTDLALTFERPLMAATSLADRSGGLYFGDLGQVYFFHPRYGIELLTRSSGLQAAGVTRFFQDREGHVWVACLRGVSKLVNRGLAGFDARHGLFDDEVSAILRRADGQVVLGHNGGLTFMGTPPRTVDFDGENPVRARVSDLIEGPGGELWFAANRLGVGHVHQDGKLEFLLGSAGELRGSYALAFDRSGRLLVGTNHGLYRREGAGFDQLDLSGFVVYRHTLIRRIVAARDGSFLICTGRDGLFRLRDDQLEQYLAAGSEPGNQTYNIHETANGEALVGTLAGLYLLRDGHLVKAGARWPAIERPVYGILEDGKGRFWFGTDNGVLRWDGQKLVHLSNRDGLLGTETNRDALQLGPRGDVWIGTDRGLTIYRDELDQAALVPPLVSITGFEVDGIEHPADEPLHLSSPAQSIAVSFRGVTFRDESRTTYLTWLENFDDSWQGPDRLPDRTVRYTRVPPGRYRFHVRVMTADGALSSTVRTEEIVVMPPVTARWWFVLSVGLAAVAVMWVFVSYLQGRRYSGQLKVKVRERTVELERSEQKLRAESRRLGTTLASISDGVVTLDEKGRVAMCNSASERILGLTEATLLGRELDEVMVVAPPLSLAPGDPTVHALSHADGRQSWVEFSVAAITDTDRGEVGKVLAFRDITARRDLENQRVRAQQLESLGVLAGGIAHDFNNLLTIILGNATLVREAATLGERERRQLDKVKSATESARALTEQFLTFARGGDPDLVPTSLEPIVRQAAALAFSEAQVSCRLELEPGLWNVELDPVQIGQVLNNLFLNACQAMAKGGTVSIRARNTRRSPDDGGAGHWVSLAVQDQGTGIAADELDRVFDPYFTTKAQGTGLGLAIAHSIVRRHGGWLTAESEPGRGATFTMVLPANAGPQRLAEVFPATAALPAGRVLVMDDEADVREVCSQLLKGLGLSCEAAADGVESLLAYQSALSKGQGFDAVIMDLTVPAGMGGKEAVQRLLEIDPKARVIVVSGYSDDPVLANYRRYGFVGALKKPFDEADLKRVLSQVLDPAAPGH